MMKRLFLLLGLVAACGDAAPPATTPTAATPTASASAAPARKPPPVAVAKRPVVHEYFGTKVTDDYEWLEDAKNPEVSAFVDAENAVTRAYFEPLAERAIVKERVSAYLGATSVDYRTLRVSGSTLYVLALQPPKQQPVLISRAESGEANTEKVVLDPNVLDPSGKTTIDMFVLSPDRKLMAVSLSKGGSESGDVHVFDLATGKEKGDVIPKAYGGTAGGSLAWNDDGTGFFYTRYPHTGEKPEADLDFFQQVYFHKLGTPESQDAYVIGKDFPRIAEIELERSEDGKNILARVANGDGGEYAHYVLKASEKGAQEGQRLAAFSDELVETTWGPDGKIYGTSLKGAPHGRVLAFAPPFDKSEVAVAETDGVIESVTVTKGAIYVAELAGGPSRIRRYSVGVKPEALARDTTPPKKKGGPPPGPATTIAPGARGPAAAELPIPAVSSVTEVRRVGEDLLVRIESFTEPPAWYRYKATEHRLAKTAMAKVAPVDLSDVEVLRETCSSKDGTKVPMTILRRKGIKLDSQNPTVLYGYGGYTVAMKPRTMKWMPTFLEQRGVVVVANLRGGSEFGAAWHDAGKLTKKQNVFDDYAACARTLGDLGYADRDHLAGHGRSNGGLLMGAALTQHPEMFRAIVSGVGYYDMLRFELSPNGAFNVTEYGSTKDQAQFNALYAYSPYANVKDGTAYPAVLLTTGANDPRVDPYHSRKMTARLQAATSSTRPILLRASADVGHGMGSPLSADIDETTDMLTFLFHELGVKVTAR